MRRGLLLLYLGPLARMTHSSPEGVTESTSRYMWESVAPKDCASASCNRRRISSASALPRGGEMAKRM